MKLFMALAIGAILYFAQWFLYRRFWDRDLNIDIEFARRVLREGERNELIETISNAKWLPLPVVQVKFAITRTFLFGTGENSSVTDQYYRNDYYSLMPYQKITRTYSFVCSKRGYYKMRGMDMLGRDLFLSKSMLKSLDHQAAVCVLPSRLEPEELPLTAKELIGETVDRMRRNEDPFEFAGLREYQSYDPMNRINWKSSARSNELRVNKFNTTFSRRVAIFLNMECHIKWREDVFIEEEIRIAATLADRFIAAHIPVAVYSNGHDAVTGNRVSVEAGADAAHLGNIETALARITMGEGATVFIEMLKNCADDSRYDDTECIIVSNYRKQDLADVFRGLRNRGISVSWIIPEYSMVEPELTKHGDKSIIKWTVGNAH